MNADLAIQQSMPMRDLILSEETANISFFRRIMKKNNQFSTQFVIQKVLKIQSQHVKDLKDDIDSTNIEHLNVDLAMPIDRQMQLDEIGYEFDFKNLNFVEATRLAIRVVEKNIQYLKSIVNQQENFGTKESLEIVINRKETFREHLENEYERLRYKKK